MIVLVCFILTFLILLKIPILREIASIGLFLAIVIFVGAVLNRAVEISSEKQRTEYIR